MTLEELTVQIKKLKLPYLECNLFSMEQDSGTFPNGGLYICKKEDIWEVYECERTLKIRKAIFYNEEDVYEYVFCYYKKISDRNRFF